MLTASAATAANASQRRAEARHELVFADAAFEHLRFGQDLTLLAGRGVDVALERAQRGDERAALRAPFDLGGELGRERVAITGGDRGTALFVLVRVHAQRSSVSERPFRNACRRAMPR
jgi:hypothetical protein